MRFSILTALTTLLTVISAAPTSISGGDSTNSLGSLERRAQTGRGTYFYQQGTTGSCGLVASDSDMVAALGTPWRNVGPVNCGRRIWVEALDGPGVGSRIEVTVQDSCPGCDPGSVDFSVGAFEKLSNYNLGVGVVHVRWDFI